MAENGSHEIHDIRVMKLDSGKFKIVFGSKTGITNLYSASTEIEIDRGLLEQFVKSSQEALKDE